MLDGLLMDQVRGDAALSAMLTTYNGKPAFFYQKAPADSDRRWAKPCYPRADYIIDMRYDPERKTSGTMIVNIYCTNESEAMPEDIERRIVELTNGTFYTNDGQDTVCAVWQRSEAFNFTQDGSTQPEVFGISVLLDILTFPAQMLTSPDPVQGLNLWTAQRYPGAKIIAFDTLPPIWNPTDEEPAIYWRFVGTSGTDVQTYAVNWYTGRFAAHIIAETVPERNRWLKAMAEAMQIDGEVILADTSPMFLQQLSIAPGADALREGQLAITGRYGVLTQQYKETSQPPMGDIKIK